MCLWEQFSVPPPFSVQGDVATAISLSYFCSDCLRTNTVTQISKCVKSRTGVSTREKAHLTVHSLAVYFEQNTLHISFRELNLKGKIEIESSNGLGWKGPQKVILSNPSAASIGILH